MKKIFTLVAGFMLTLGAVNAQNLNLDTWTTSTDADGWNEVLNGFTAFGLDTSVYQATGVTNSCALLIPADLTALGAPIAASLMSLGTNSEGMVYTTKPVNLAAYARFDNPGGGQANVTATLLKHNASTQIADTLAIASWDIMNATGGAFVLGGAAFVYNPAFSALTPDSMKIDILAASSDPAAARTIALYVDEISFPAVLSTANVNRNTGALSVFPTLANTHVNFVFNSNNTSSSVINVTDLSGKTVKSVSVNSNYNMNTNDLQNGVYIYSVLDKNTNTLTSGKFVVLH